MKEHLLSRDASLFLMVEIRNIDGIQPATLGSAYDSFRQTPIDILLSYCGYKATYQMEFANRLENELELELRRLIKKYGKKKNLETVIGG